MKPFVWQCKAKQGIASCYVYDAASAERAADTWTVTELYTADQLREAQVKVLREAADQWVYVPGEDAYGFLRSMADELETQNINIVGQV